MCNFIEAHKLYDPLLDQIAFFLSTEAPHWSGHSTELSAILGGEIEPHLLTRKLNTCACKLENDYQIVYSSKRTNLGRIISLTLEN